MRLLRNAFPVALLLCTAALAWSCGDGSEAKGIAPEESSTSASDAASSSTTANDGAPDAGDSGVDRCFGVDATVPSDDDGKPSAAVDGGYGAVPFPPENPYRYPKALLGKTLFWDEQLSSDDTVACGSCHRPAAGGSDPRALTARHPGPDGMLGTTDDPHGGTGIVRCDDSSGVVVRKTDPIFGAGPQVTPRKPGTYLDAMFSNALFWDGRATTQFVDPNDAGSVVIANGGALENQATFPLMSSGEMACEGRTWAKLEAKLATLRPLARAKQLPASLLSMVCRYPTYPQLFAAAFGSPEITASRIVMAIATHERTLVSDQTPWDRDFAGDPTAMTAAQKHGRDVFFGINGATNANCPRCHAAPTFAFDTVSDGFQFANLGFDDDAGVGFDRGRSVISGFAADDGRFRTITLRNVGLREAAGLLHHGTGEGADLPTLVKAYDKPPKRNYNFSPGMVVPLNLTAQDQMDLVDFLRNALTDPRAAAESPPFDRPRLSTE